MQSPLPWPSIKPTNLRIIHPLNEPKKPKTTQASPEMPPLEDAPLFFPLEESYDPRCGRNGIRWDRPTRHYGCSSKARHELDPPRAYPLVRKALHKHHRDTLDPSGATPSNPNLGIQPNKLKAKKKTRRKTREEAGNQIFNYFRK
jgi:hypothetical protein